MTESHPFVSIQRQRLAESMRHLIDAILTVEDATEEQLGTASDMVEAAARHLGRVPHPEHGTIERGTWTRPHADHDDYLPRSPLVGEVSPLAPPVEWEYVDDRIVAHGMYHAAYEGPPGYVHGGWVTLTFDELLGMANIASGHPGMTGTLKVRYLRPTPLHTRVDLEGWTDRVEGRRIVSKGIMKVNGEVTAEAEGLFVTINPEMAAEYFGRTTGEAAEPGVPPDSALEPLLARLRPDLARCIREDVRREADRTRPRRRRPDRPGLPRGRPRGAARGDRLGRPRRVAHRRDIGRAGVGAYLRLGLSVPDLARMLSVEQLSDEGRALIDRLGPSGDWTTPVGPRTWPNLPHPRLLARAVTRPLGIRPEAVLGVTFPDGRVPTESWAQALRPITGDDWPSDPLWICTVRQDDARRVVFGRDGAPKTDLATAVAASAAIPGYFQPVEIDGRRYVDGGAHTPTNADVVRNEDLDLVLVSSPMSTSRHGPLISRSGPFRRHFRHRLAQEVRKLQWRGIPVVVFQPSGGDQEAMGTKAMDTERNAAVVRAARETTLRRLEHGRHADRLAVLAV